MKKYIDRLIKCGYSYDDAKDICCDFIKNLSLFSLECFVLSVENRNYVEKI